MAIVKRGARYQVKLRSPQGDWWTQTCATRKAAEQVEREMRTARDLGQSWQHPRDRAGRLTVREVCERYTELHRGRLARATLLLRAQHLERFVAWGEDLYPRGFLSVQLSRALLERWADERLAAGNAASTVRTLLQAPISVWAWAYDYDAEYGWEGLIPRYRRPVLPKQGRPVTLAPSWAEVDAMIAQLGPRWARRTAILQRYLGTRIGETLRLRWDDLVKLEGAEGAPLAFALRPEATKGGYGSRLIPLHADLAARLETWPRTHELVIGAQAERALRLRGYVARVYRRAWEASGARPHVWSSPTHCVRRCVKTQLTAAGCSSLEVNLILGHSLSATDHAYIDRGALNLPGVVAKIPALSGEVKA